MNGKHRILATMIAIAFASLALAQGNMAGGTAAPARNGPAGAAPGAAATHVLKAVRLSKLEGVNIHDGDGKRIGEVEDVVVDAASGRILHALVSIGGVMGVGDKHYVVPLKQLQVYSRSAEDNTPLKIQLGTPVDSLEAAKPLDKDSPYVLGTKLLGTDVDDSGGRDAGEIEDLIIDLQAGEAKVALIEFEKEWPLGDKLVVVALPELQRGKGKDLLLDVSKDTVAQKPAIEKSRLDKVDLSAQPWMQAQPR
jgi:sporulation protein YlmC with PRC-barrel domain